MTYLPTGYGRPTQAPCLSCLANPVPREVRRLHSAEEYSGKGSRRFVDHNDRLRVTLMRFSGTPYSLIEKAVPRRTQYTAHGGAPLTATNRGTKKLSSTPFLAPRRAFDWRLALARRRLGAIPRRLRSPPAAFAVRCGGVPTSNRAPPGPAGTCPRPSPAPPRHRSTRASPWYRSPSSGWPPPSRHRRQSSRLPSR